jgi:acetyl esterase/lipase
MFSFATTQWKTVMVRYCVVPLFLLFAFAGQAVYAQEEVPLWPNGAPGFKHQKEEVAEDRRETGRLDRYLSYVSTPTLTLYPVTGPTTPGPVVLVLPGGGLRYVAIDKEGHEVARWLNSQGIAAAVLKYRTARADAEPSWDLYSPLLALGDAGRAIRVLRHHAGKWGIDPNRIGVLGFSAGGTMAIRHTIDATDGKPDAADLVERMSSRANSIALVYTTLPDQKLPKVDKNTPYFIVHGASDPKAMPGIATKLFSTIQNAGGSAELHVFRHGDHGFGIAPANGTVRAWPNLYVEWLKDTVR